ncbi:MAG: septation protein IspZ [Proteobacteria bacterium]|nr:septation protein IspZ [Pseudomonadota bacterium]
MTAVFELAPLAAFFLAYAWQGLYAATAVLMVASVIALLAHRLLTGRFKDMHLITVALVLPLGSATLILHDKRFIQWKPTAVFGVLAGILLVSGMIGRKPLIQRLFAAMMQQGLELQPRTWQRLNLLWVCWFALSAAANLYVAQHFSERVWVHFHTYGLSIATFLFMLPQILWIASRTSAGS